MARPTDIHQSSKDGNELKRYHKHKAKWAYGVRPLPGRRIISGDSCRPVPHGRNRSTLFPLPPRRTVGRRKAGIRDDVNDGVSAHEYCDIDATFVHPESTPADDPNLFYSFDAMRSPGHGEHILSVALARAMDRFEVKETEKVVREYEIVEYDEGSEDGVSDVASADEDGFEVVDYPKM